MKLNDLQTQVNRDLTHAPLTPHELMLLQHYETKTLRRERHRARRYHLKQIPILLR